MQRQIASASIFVAPALLAVSFGCPAAFGQTQSANPPTLSPQQSATEQQPALAGKIYIAPDVQAAKLIKMVPPVYPQIAAQAHIEGAVVLHVLIAEDGSVKDVRILSGPLLLIPAAIEAVMQWRYQPTLLNGEPVSVDSIVSVFFSLHPNTDLSAASQVPLSQEEARKAFLAPDKVCDTKLIKMVHPKYPRDAKKAHVEGDVILYLTITTDGTVKDLTFVSGPTMLRTAAIDAVSKWRYKPCLVGGKAVGANSIVTVIFTLN